MNFYLSEIEEFKDQYIKKYIKYFNKKLSLKYLIYFYILINNIKINHNEHIKNEINNLIKNITLFHKYIKFPSFYKENIEILKENYGKKYCPINLRDLCYVFILEQNKYNFNKIKLKNIKQLKEFNEFHYFLKDVQYWDFNINDYDQGYIDFLSR